MLQRIFAWGQPNKQVPIRLYRPAAARLLVSAAGAGRGERFNKEKLETLSMPKPRMNRKATGHTWKNASLSASSMTQVSAPPSTAPVSMAIRLGVTIGSRFGV